ncbi:MAG TPA: GntR family transcriptional regulator [Clostridia bacterium]|nr:GntR family transcriptional regulator [Clostridia bacterium]
MKNDRFTPKYKFIHEDLSRKIRAGDYGDGEKLPYERELCQDYGVERITVRHALNLLEEDGLIVKRPGVGSFVRREAAAPERQSKVILFAMHKNQNDIRHNVNAFNAMLFFLMEQACRECGHTLLYTSVQDTDERISALEGSGAAGILLISHHKEALLANIFSTNVPVVCINHLDPRTLSILPDNAGGVQAAVARLAEWGHRRIGFIAGTPMMVNAAERLDDFRHALWKNGLECDPDLFAPGDWTYDGGREAMRRLMGAERRPTAVFAASDMMAIGAIEAVRQAKLRVPEDISVIGFDNIDMGVYCTPALTTVGVDARQIAQIAVESILRFAKNPPREVDRYAIRVPATLIERASAGHAPEAR